MPISRSALALRLLLARGADGAVLRAGSEVRIAGHIFRRPVMEGLAARGLIRRVPPRPGIPGRIELTDAGLAAATAIRPPAFATAAIRERRA